MWELPDAVRSAAHAPQHVEQLAVTEHDSYQLIDHGNSQVVIGPRAARLDHYTAGEIAAAVAIPVGGENDVSERTKRGTKRAAASNACRPRLRLGGTTSAPLGLLRLLPRALGGGTLACCGLTLRLHEPLGAGEFRRIVGHLARVFFVQRD